jgi:hypothetical protein
MSIPITYSYVNLHSCGNVRHLFKIENDKAYFKINHVETNTSIEIENDITITFKQLNYYTLTFTAYPKGCPLAMLPISLEELVVFPGTELTVTQGTNSITVSGVIPIGTKLRIYTNPKLLRYVKSLELCGVLGVSNVSDELNAITVSDAATKIRYIPSTPAVLSLLPLIPYPPASGPGSNPLLPGQYPALNSVFPWREAIIPWEKEQVFPTADAGLIITPDAPFGLTPFPALPVPPFPTGSINGYPDQYDKLKSVPDSVIYYIGFDQKLILPKAESWTLFLTNFEDRGYSGEIDAPEWMIANYQKKVYMNALSLDKLQFYIPKIEQFVNNSFSDVTTYGKPLTSSFEENLILFFLRIHIGNQDYPDYVIKWFSDFITFVGIGDASNPERSQLLMYGNTTSPKIFDYFEEKNIEVISNGDKTSIAYWWSQAGLSAKALVFECVHNIVAFSQFTNVIYSTVYAGLHPNNPLFGPSGVIAPLPGFPQYKNFLTEYAAASGAPGATGGNNKLNVIRECYRLLVPNSLSFSLVDPVVPDPDGNVIKSRHSHQSLMISNSSAVGPYTNPPLPLPASVLAQFNQSYNYFTYNPGQYDADFNTDLDDLVGLQVVTDILDASITSNLDKETVVDVTTLPSRPIVPIFSKPTYAPFGLGYRRCAGEMLSYLITEKLFDKFSTVEYEERPTADYPLISIAPFKRVSDNIFVKQQ